MLPSRRFNRRQALVGIAGLSAWSLHAQPSFPARGLRIVVPFGAGGVADLTARALGQRLAEQLSQSVVIENRPGAGGVAAGEAVARSEPDGHTLLLMSNGTAVSAGLFRSLPFDAQRDFAPVSVIGTFDLAIVVPENSRFRTLSDLLTHARANPGRLNVGTINIGSTQHLAAELFKSTAGITAQTIPFNGTPAVVTALRGGEIDVAVEILGPVLGQIQGRALRALAVLGDHRSAALPDVPTVAESGGSLARFDVSSWNALAVPARTPREVIARLNREVNVALGQADLRRRLAELNVSPRPGTPEQLSALLAAEIRRWSDVIQQAGIPRQ